MPVTKAIFDAAEMVEDAVGRYLKAKANLSRIGKYESDVEATILFNIVLRHAEAICTLAKRDLVMLPSAYTIARSAFETTGRILWMLAPDEIFDREARYLAHLAGEESFYKRVAVLAKEFGKDEKPWQQAEAQIHGFRTEVEKLLPKTAQPVTALPNFRAMLKDVGLEERYGNYMRLSQFAHGAHAAGQLYRKNLGNGKVGGEFIYPESWAEPLNCAWWCLAKGGSTIIIKLGGDPEHFISDAFLQEVQEALNKI